MKTTSFEKPEEIVIGNHLGQPQYTINFNIEKKETEDMPTYSFHTVTLPPGQWNYGVIVSALVEEVFPSDKMDAIVNNYLWQPEDEEIKAEFQEMQQWRIQAKEIATRLLNTTA